MSLTISRSRKPQSHQEKSLVQRIKQHGWGYLFLAPTVLLTAVFVIYPIIGSVRYAFYNWDGIGEPTQFVGWRHFQTVASDKYFWNAFWHTIIYAVVLVPIQLTLALILALVLNNPKLKGANFYRAVYFLPVVTSIAVIGVVLSLLFTRASSSFPDWLIKLGWVKPALGITGDPNLALPVIIIVGIWHTLGYNMVFFLAALQSVPAELYEAARIDGAGRFARFWYMTIPLIRPIGTIILFMAILGSLQVFDLVWVITRGGPFYASDVVSTYVYGYAFTSERGASQANYGYASAASLFMSSLVLGVTALQILLVARARRKRADLGLG
jgi:raffinose/stachyose/melibiose transport system permease protein